MTPEKRDKTKRPEQTERNARNRPTGTDETDGPIQAKRNGIPFNHRSLNKSKWNSVAQTAKNKGGVIKSTRSNRNANELRQTVHKNKDTTSKRVRNKKKILFSFSLSLKTFGMPTERHTIVIRFEKPSPKFVSAAACPTANRTNGSPHRQLASSAQ